jgi:hypothetical protein
MAAPRGDGNTHRVLAARASRWLLAIALLGRVRIDQPRAAGWTDALRPNCR